MDVADTGTPGVVLLQIGAAPAATPRLMAHHHVRIVDLGAASNRVNPGCLPGLRPVFLRWDCLRACRNARSEAVSDDGGFDEFDEFRFNNARSSATKASSSATLASSSAIRCCSAPT